MTGERPQGCQAPLAFPFPLDRVAKAGSCILTNWKIPIDRLKSDSLFRALASPHLKHVLCLAVSILGVLLKFWLIFQMEISDATDDPHEYVMQILYPSQGGLAYPPGTGMLGQFFHGLGIPFHLGIEALFIFAAALVLRVLVAWPSRSYLSLGLFLFTILNPNPTELFCHMMSDQVWLVETMLGLSCAALAMQSDTRPKWSHLALAVLFFGLSAITRSTFIPLMACLISFVGLALAFIAIKLKKQPDKEPLIVLLLCAWSLLFGVSAVYYGTCFYDANRYGYFGISVIDSSEYKKFYTCLQSVGPSGNDTYFPIDENRRKLIEQAGPVSHWFIGEVEKNSFYKQIGLEHYGKADIPAGWFHFATFNAILPAVDGDLRKSFALLEAIENEIAGANRRGVLHVRPLLPLPDGRLHLVLAAYPQALGDTTKMVVYQPSPDFFTWKYLHSKYRNSEFSMALTRRTVHESAVREKIWRTFCGLYSCVYTLPLFYLCLALQAVFLALLAFTWNRSAEISLFFLAQQFFALFFVVHIFWYALFDASGLYVFSRYMIFPHVMLPILIAYYLSAIGGRKLHACSLSKFLRIYF
jgi:hypothetical protein